MGFFSRQRWGRTMLLTAALAVAVSVGTAAQTKGTFKDSRDGKTYKTAVIGGKKWMAENLNVKTGTSWCYGDQEANCKKYGRLYPWSTAAKMACPDGWHLPTRDEWGALAKAAGGTGAYGAGGTAGTKLKSTADWDAVGSGTDQFGFSALPAGLRFPSGTFSSAGFGTAGSAGNFSNSSWWTVTQTADGNAYARGVSSSEKNLTEFADEKDKGYSVRCVEGEATESVIDVKPKKDGGSAATFTDSRDRKAYKTAKIGKQVWMAENLNYSWDGSECDDDYCQKYGRLYGWGTAMALPDSCTSRNCTSKLPAKHRGICPGGWHIPSDAEWTTLTDFAGGSPTAATKLKAKSGWIGSGNGTDAYGFSALPGGSDNANSECEEDCGDIGNAGFWWSASEDRNDSYIAHGWRIDNNSVERVDGDKSAESYSVRCVQD